MNVIDALNSRYTCRAFKQDPVAQDTVIKILEAANRTPSWGNTQPWNLYVAAGELLEELRKGSLERFSQKLPERQTSQSPRNGRKPQAALYYCRQRTL